MHLLRKGLTGVGEVRGLLRRQGYRGVHRHPTKCSAAATQLLCVTTPPAEQLKWGICVAPVDCKLYTAHSACARLVQHGYKSILEASVGASVLPARATQPQLGNELCLLGFASASVNLFAASSRPPVYQYLLPISKLYVLYGRTSWVCTCDAA